MSFEEKIFNFVVGYFKSKIDDAKQFFVFFLECINEPSIDYIYPQIPNNHLVMIQHKGIFFVAKVHDYEMTRTIKAKICYLNDSQTTPSVILNKSNFKYTIGDAREFIAQHGDKLLDIAQIIKTRSVLTLINIYTVLQKQNELEELDRSKVKKAHKTYRTRIRLIENSWNS